MRPNIDQAEDFISALPYSDRRGEVRRRTDKQLGGRVGYWQQVAEIDMTPTASIPPLGSEFNDFLFALVGEDRNGMPLSVVSVLARMDLDPWVEAANLADLPAETAVRKLASWLDALSDPALKPTSPDSRADRLIALLPRRAAPHSPPSLDRTGAVAAARPRTLIKAVLFAIFLILSLGIQLFVARREPPARPEILHAPASAVVPSQPPPTSSSKRYHLERPRSVSHRTDVAGPFVML